MAYLIAVALSLIAFGGFLILTAVERSRQARLFAGARGRLDARMERAHFVMQHVDWGAFLSDVARTGLERALHDIAHTTLLLVRALERALTRTVRALRERRAAGLEAPRADRPNPVMRTTQYLRTTLRATRRPRALDIPRAEETGAEE